MKQPEIPAGVAPFYVDLPTMTICTLVKVDKHGNLPKFSMQLKPLATGFAFVHPVDQNDESYDCLKGRTIALGRAIKAYEVSVHFWDSLVKDLAW